MTRRALPVLLLTTLALASACGESDREPDPRRSADPATDPSTAGAPGAGAPAWIDYATVDPLSALDRLAGDVRSQVNVGDAPAGWITEAHVEHLLERIDDKRPAAVVVSVSSSYVPFGETSTVGREALFFIEGFRTGRYPPTICSVKYFEPDPDEVRRWWADRHKHR